MKVCSRHLGHMTKMAAMPIYILYGNVFVFDVIRALIHVALNQNSDAMYSSFLCTLSISRLFWVIALYYKKLYTSSQSPVAAGQGKVRETEQQHMIYMHEITNRLLLSYSLCLTIKCIVTGLVPK